MASGLGSTYILDGPQRAVRLDDRLPIHLSRVAYAVFTKIRVRKMVVGRRLACQTGKPDGRCDVKKMTGRRLDSGAPLAPDVGWTGLGGWWGHPSGAAAESWDTVTRAVRTRSTVAMYARLEGGDKKDYQHSRVLFLAGNSTGSLDKQPDILSTRSSHRRSYL